MTARPDGEWTAAHEAALTLGYSQQPMSRLLPLALLTLAACPEPVTMPNPDLPAECPETMSQTCFPALCGEKLNSCGQRVSCGTCQAGQICTASGVCQVMMQCVPDVMGACIGTAARNPTGAEAR